MELLAERVGAQGARPFLKWAGGKYALAPRLAALLPHDLAERTYREPFVGAGGLFFWLRSQGLINSAILSDTLEDLVNAYQVVRDDPVALLDRLTPLREGHSKEQFYAVRKQFNKHWTGTASQRAAWLVYLNKTCFNGLFRTNSKGVFNVPFGDFKNPNIADPERICAASDALQGVTIAHLDFGYLADDARPGDVIYLDPPYVPLSKTANFAGYAGGFGPADQARLAYLYRVLDERGCLLALSNSDTPEVRSLYAGFDLTPIQAWRSIGAAGASRVPVGELVVRNTRRWPTAQRAPLFTESGAA